jgi:serine/threonine protein kinase
MNKYALFEKLGDGGYGSVYLCRDQHGIRYACKQLPFAKNKRSRVQREVEIMERFTKSTRVSRLIDACEDGDSFYIVQEWCKGGALKDYMGGHALYGENAVASIIRGVLRGLCHIHQAAVIHRDIKGSNIMFADKTDDAEIKIIDFGAAVKCDASGHPIECPDMVGTPWFISPEGLSHTFTYKSDIWSVGVVTYQLLCGKMPFNDKDNPLNPGINAIFRSIFTDTPKMEGGIWDEISVEAKDFVTCCLHKDYNKRPMAEDALNHAWLARTNCDDRFKGTPLHCTPFQYEEVSSMMDCRTLWVAS